MPGPMWDENSAALLSIGLRIAAVIRQCQEDLGESGLSEVDLDLFDQHVERQRAHGWVTDPTAYRNMQEINGFDQAKSRSQVIRALLKIPVNGVAMYPRSVQTEGQDEVMVKAILSYLKEKTDDLEKEKAKFHRGQVEYDLVAEQLAFASDLTGHISRLRSEVIDD